MRSRNRKIKKQGARLGSVGNYAGRASCGRCVGYGSCAALLLVVFLLVNPVVGNEAQALEEGDYAMDKGLNSEDQIMPLAESSTSSNSAGPATVNISLPPTSGSASLTPTNSTGASARVDVKANINVTNTGGYSIYISGQNANLTGEKTGQIIPAATTATTFANLATNTWAYTAVEGSSVPDTATYSALPVGQGATLKSVSGNQDSVNHTYMLSFATKIANNKPADTYKNQITLSVTASPKTLTLSQLTNMQDMTTASCSISTVGETKQLRDIRDGKYYWVTKLADQKCWMTQNLALDLSTSKTLTSADSDVASSWTPGYSTETSASIFANNTGQKSWNLGSYYIKAPNGTSNCGTSKSNLAACTSHFTALATPTSANGDNNAHYLVGNYYQWNAVTAGTGGTITSGQATNSICPKGWRLPTNNNSTIGSYKALISAGSINDVATLVGAPYYFVKAGNIWPDSKLLGYAGSNGTYWTSTPDADGARSLNLYFTTTITVNNDWYRQMGLSVRCIAR